MVFQLMYTNSNMTIYNKFYDKATRLDKYKRTIIRNVFFDETKASNRLQSGLESADSVFVLVPFGSLPRADYVPYTAFDGFANNFTFNIGDMIIKGEVYDEITSKPTDLDKLHETYTITSVDTKDFGSSHMRHIQLGAR